MTRLAALERCAEGTREGAFQLRASDIGDAGSAGGGCCVQEFLRRGALGVPQDDVAGASGHNLGLGASRRGECCEQGKASHVFCVSMWARMMAASGASAPA